MSLPCTTKYSLEFNNLSTIGVGKAAQKILKEVGTGESVLTIAVVAIDDGEKMGGVEAEFSALVVAGGSANASKGIAVDRETSDVEGATPNAFVGFAFATDSKGQGNVRIGRNLIGIKTTYTVAVGDAGEVDEVYEGIDAIEFLALKCTSDKGFSTGAIAAGIFAATSVGCAGGLDGRHLLNAINSISASIIFDEAVNLLPEFGAELTVADGSKDSGAHKLGAPLSNLV